MKTLRHLIALALIPCLLTGDVSAALQAPVGGRAPIASAPAAQAFEQQALVAALPNFIYYPLSTGKVWTDRLLGTWHRSHLGRQVALKGWQGTAAARLSLVLDWLIRISGIDRIPVVRQWAADPLPARSRVPSRRTPVSSLFLSESEDILDSSAHDLLPSVFGDELSEIVEEHRQRKRLPSREEAEADLSRTVVLELDAAVSALAHAGRPMDILEVLRAARDQRRLFYLNDPHSLQAALEWAANGGHMPVRRTDSGWEYGRSPEKASPVATPLPETARAAEPEAPPAASETPAVQKRHRFVDPTTGRTIPAQTAVTAILLQLRSGHSVEVTHEDPDLGEGTLLRMANGASDRVEAKFGSRTVVLSLKLALPRLQLGGRTPEVGRALLAAFRDRAADRPTIDEEIARRLHQVRAELTAEDLIWLAQELADGHIESEKALEWILYLFYQRDRSWDGLTNSLRDSVISTLKAAASAGRFPSTRLSLDLFLYPVATALTSEEAAQPFEAVGPERWRLATEEVRASWVRSAIAHLRKSGSARAFLTMTVAEALGIPSSTFNRTFVNPKEAQGFSAYALGMCPFILSTHAIEIGVVLVKYSPDDLAFTSQVMTAIGRTFSQITKWVWSTQPVEASDFLLRNYEILSDRQWAAQVIDPSAERPSPLERRVVSTLLRERIANLPARKLRDKDLLKPFKYHGQPISLGRLLNVMRPLKLAKNDGSDLVFFVLRRYGLLDPEVAHKAKRPEDLKTLDDLKQALDQGSFKSVPWDIIYRSHPELIGVVVRKIG